LHPLTAASFALLPLRHSCAVILALDTKVAIFSRPKSEIEFWRGKKNSAGMGAPLETDQRGGG